MFLVDIAVLRGNSPYPHSYLLAMTDAEYLSNSPSYHLSQIYTQPRRGLGAARGGQGVNGGQGGRARFAPVNTPPMPILDDVTSRSRNRLRDIGSRPLSDNFEKYFQAEG